MTSVSSHFKSNGLGSSKSHAAHYQLINQTLQEDLDACQQRQVKLKDLVHALAELTPSPVAITSIESNRILLKNQFVEPLFGISSGETFDPIEPRFYANAIKQTQLLNRLKSGEQLVNYKLQLKTVHGEIQDTLVSAQVVEYEEQQAILWIWTDITEQTPTQPIDALTAQKKVELVSPESEAQF